MRKSLGRVFLVLILLLFLGLLSWIFLIQFGEEKTPCGTLVNNIVEIKKIQEELS